MKSLKTYNMDKDVINILSRQPNKSAHVNKCVRAYHKNKAKLEPQDLELKELLVHAVQKMDFKDSIRPILVERINSL